MDLTSGLELGHSYTRPELSKLWELGGHQGISRGVYTPAGQNVIFLFVTRHKQNCLTQYKDFLEGDLLYWEGETGHGNDERIASASSRGESIHLFYRERHHSEFVYYGKVILANIVRYQNKPSEFVFKVVNVEVHDAYSTMSAVADVTADYQLASESTLNNIDRQVLTKSRGVAQRLFRGNLFRLWDGSCAVTGVREPKVLKAGHIKPWAACAPQEKIDHFNGLLLIPNLDSLFNEHLISFKDNGELLVSDKFHRDDRRRMHISEELHLRQVFDQTRPYLELHRTKCLCP